MQYGQKKCRGERRSPPITGSPCVTEKAELGIAALSEYALALMR